MKWFAESTLTNHHTWYTRSMPKARDYHLTEKELQVVEIAMKRDQRPGVRQRCTTIRLLHLGYKPEEVAKMQAVSIPTVYSCVKRWREGGFGRLYLAYLRDPTGNKLCALHRG